MATPGVGNGNPLQYSHVENSTNRRAWQAIALGVAESDTTERLSMHAHAQPYLSPIPPESQLPSVLSYRSQGKCHYLGCSGLKLRASLNCSFCLSPHIWLDLTMLNSHHLSSLESVFPFHTDGHHQSTGGYCFLPQLLKLYLDLLPIKMHPTRHVSHSLFCDLPINTCWDTRGP